MTGPHEEDREGRQPRIGLVTVSDRANRGEYEDRSGPALARWLEQRLLPPFELLRRLVPDEPDELRTVLLELVDEEACDLVLTSGGTGPAPRDVTPDVTASVCDRLLPGFAEEMRRVSLLEVPTALLSRQVVGSRGRCLVLNLPGSPRAIDTCLGAIFAAVPHCLSQLGAARLELDPERLRAPENPHPTPPERTR